MATINGQFDLAIGLTKLGADPNIASIHGTAPLFAAIERRWPALAAPEDFADSALYDPAHPHVLRPKVRRG